MAEDRSVNAPDPVPDTLEVTVLRSGGVAGMVRRWTAQIPDDGTPAARAARRIARLGGDVEAPGNWRSKERGRVRDAFQWTITCRDGSLRYDDAGRRDDSDVDDLIRRVTLPQAEGAG